MVSVIVPVYNREKYLHDCLESLINQNYKDYEIILVDDGSVDGSRDLCDEYAMKFQNIRVFHTEHIGASGARNIGLNNACGNLIMFCDSDDTVEPNWITKLASSMIDSDVVMSICSFNIVKNNKCMPNSAMAGLRDSFNIENYLFESSKYYLNTVWHSCYRNTSCRFHEGLNYGEDSIYNMEYILGYADASKYKIQYVDEYLYNYRADTFNSLSNRKDTRILFYECRNALYMKFLEKCSYSDEKTNLITNMMELDRFGEEVNLYLSEKKYAKLKTLFVSPMWEKYVAKQTNSKLKWILSRKSIFLIKLCYNVYVPLKERFK